MNMHTYTPPADRETIRRLYEDRGMSQEEVAEALRTTRKRIYTAMRLFAIPRRRPAKRNQRGPNNSSWKGDKAGYSALHLRVASVRGKPSRCEVCGSTEAPHYDWANMTGNYADVMDYMRMCRSCHWKNDGTIRNVKRIRD